MIKRIVLAGGPCAGKSVALEIIPKRLPDYKFIIVPEAASIVLAGTGGRYGKDTQDRIFKLKMHHEQVAHTKASNSSHKYNIILYDRGLLDGLVYQKSTYYQRLADFSMTHEDAKARYDHVIYMYSAARGATEHYSNETNLNRTESVDRAAHICRKTEAAWQQHPNVTVIDNSTDFAGKIDRVVYRIILIMREVKLKEYSIKWKLHYLD